MLLAGNNGKGAGCFLLAGPAQVVDGLGKVLAAAIGGRGGGRNGKFQGKAKQLENVPAAIKLMEESVAKHKAAA